MRLQVHQSSKSSQRIVAFGSCAEASLPSSRGDGWCPDSHLPKWSSTGIRWSTVQLNLRWGHVLMRRHRRLVTGTARMGDHNGRTSPARCCTSVTDSFQDGSSACCVPRLLFPCVSPLRVCVTARLLRSACALIMSALTHSRHDRQVRSDSQPVVCLSVCLSLQTHALWPEATRQRSCRLLTASRFLQRHALLPREGEQVNRVWSALLIRLICCKWAENNTGAKLIRKSGQCVSCSCFNVLIW